MDNLITLPSSPVAKQEVREAILGIEAGLHEYNRANHFDEPDCPLTHHFAPGAYGREIFLPKDSLVVGKIHKHTHLNMIMKGKVSVATEDGVQTLVAPRVMVSQAGTKRVVYAHEDTIWVTVHLTTSQDLAQIEEEIIAKTYSEFDALQGVDVSNLLEVVAQEKENLLCLG